MRIPIAGGHFFAGQGALSALLGCIGEPTLGIRIVLTGPGEYAA